MQHEVEQLARPLLKRGDILLVVAGLTVLVAFLVPSVLTVFPFLVTCITLATLLQRVDSLICDIAPTLRVQIGKRAILRLILMPAIYYTGPYVVIVVCVVFGFAAPIAAKYMGFVLGTLPAVAAIASYKYWAPMWYQLEFHVVFHLLVFLHSLLTSQADTSAPVAYVDPYARPHPRSPHSSPQRSPNRQPAYQPGTPSMLPNSAVPIQPSTTRVSKFNQ